MKSRILIADDHEILREGVNSLLTKARSDWEICGEASNGEEALRLVQQQKPDLIILDISMPRMSGLEVCSRLRKLGVAAPVLIFTTHYSERLSIEASEAGAQGYVVKSQAAKDLVLAIEALLNGGTFFGQPKKRPAAKNEEPDPGILRRCGLAWQFGF